MKKSNFNHLLQRYLSGQVSEQERIKIETWLDVMKTGNSTELELSEAEEEELFKKITTKTNNIDEVASFRPQKFKPVKHTFSFMKVAAAFAVLVTASFLIWTQLSDSPLTNNLSGGMEKSILPDGTIVWMQPGSKLSELTEEDGFRTVSFSGEALFEVAKDPNHPFIIRSGQVNVQVLGTSFNLKTLKDSLSLMVLTGKVNLSANSTNTSIDVHPFEKVTLVKGALAVQAKVMAKEIQMLTANSEYNMSFSNESLSNVIAKMEAKFNTPITIQSKKASVCRVTADFTDHSLESTLQLLTEILDVNYTRINDEILITGNGCN